MACEDPNVRTTDANESFRSLNQLSPSYMFDSTDFIDEYNLLNTFLNRNLLENDSSWRYIQESPDSDSTLVQTAESRLASNNCSYLNDFIGAGSDASLMPKTVPTSKASNLLMLNEAQERYYISAADPAECGFPEERMNKLLKAKYDAGMLKPYNYVNGYARLNQYMEHNLQQQSKQKILRQLDNFRPNFRKIMHTLTDMELVMVEMWFEKALMEYERIFASMAIPACCWRRTGEISRGNRDMAELIHVNVNELRDVCKYVY